MRFGVGICFLIVTGAMVRVIIHEAPGRVSKQKREPGESGELFAGTWERGQISNVWLGIYSVAELLPCTLWKTRSLPFSCSTQTWCDCLISETEWENDGGRR